MALYRFISGLIHQGQREPNRRNDGVIRGRWGPGWRGRPVADSSVKGVHDGLVVEFRRRRAGDGQSAQVDAALLRLSVLLLV